MALKISRTIALVVGIALPIIEGWRRWNMLADWPSWLDDCIAAGLLFYGWRNGRPYLMAAWGYTFGMAYVSFFGQIHNPTTDPSGFSQNAVLAFKGFGMMLAVLSLALAWIAPESRERR